MVYDATQDNGRRHVRKVTLVDEDSVLKLRERQKLISDTRTLHRNFAVAAWAKRKHLDYVTSFSFVPRTGDASLDRRLAELMEWFSRPINCDVTGRFSLPQIIRLAEDRAVTDGDVFLAKIEDGRLQAIESDRVQTPTGNIRDLPRGFKPDEWINGIRLDKLGQHFEYAICKRDGFNGYTLEQIIPAWSAYHHGFFDRFDMVRGISPIASAINAYADIYEANEYALAKAKVAQIFGMKVTRSGDVSLDGDADPADPRTLNFGQGPQVFDLEPGEDAEFMESKTPSTEFASYMQQMLAVALKSLDIPYSFYNESFTNYSGARQALLQYEQSASNRRKVVEQLLNNITVWRLGLFIEDGWLELPAGMEFRDVKWRWLHTGLPWIDPAKEAAAEISLVNANMASRQQLAAQHGRDWQQIAEDLAYEKQMMAALGLGTGEAEPPVVEPDPAETEEENTEDK